MNLNLIADINAVFDILERGKAAADGWFETVNNMFSKMPAYEQEYTPEISRQLADERIARVNAVSEKRDELKGETEQP